MEPIYTSVLVVSNLNEAASYKRVYAKLLDDVLVVTSHNFQKLEGLRISRTFFTETVSPYCAAVDTAQRSMMMSNQDLFPIQLRMNLSKISVSIDLTVVGKISECLSESGFLIPDSVDEMIELFVTEKTRE